MEKSKNLFDTKKLIYFLISLLLFVSGYLILNYEILRTGVLFRLAAHDMRSASLNMVSYMAQGALLVVVVTLIKRGYLAVLFALIAVSGATNLVYQSVLEDVLSASSLEWLLGESRSFLPAFKQFGFPFLMGAVKVLLVLILFWLGREMARKPLKLGQSKSGKWTLAMVSIALFLGFFLLDPLLGKLGRARGAEANVYGMLAQIMLQETPHRRPVEVALVQKPMVKKILWLVDESVEWQHFDQLLRPEWTGEWKGLDYGASHSLANCSAQSNAAMRWGVNVDEINATTDLRTNSTIWAYAQKAGYRTLLIDGQVQGNPQNYVWPNELSMIDDFKPSAAGLDTDLGIAKQLNAVLKSEGMDYVYVVLKGAHYQYTNNYPGGEKDVNLPLEEQYRKAVSYSKKDFMKTLFSEVDRNQVAVFYTSDHGQHIAIGKTPHCTESPTADEFSVPLVFFLGDALRPEFSKHSENSISISNSQIFPTTLVLMGYDKNYASSAYDNPFPQASKKIIKLGKTIIPSADKKTIKIFNQ